MSLTFHNNDLVSMKLTVIYSLEQAAFCLEELILLNPRNPQFLAKYSEVQQTLGNTALALKVTCRQAELDPNNPATWQKILRYDLSHVERV